MSEKQINMNPSSVLGTQNYGNSIKESNFAEYFSIFAPLSVLLLILHLPVALIFYNIIPFQHRFTAFFFIMGGFILFCFMRRYSLREIGFRVDNIRASLLLNLLFVIVGAICLYFTYKAGFLREKTQSSWYNAYLFYVIILGPVQEVIYRGILNAEVERTGILGNRTFLLLSTISFSFLHIIFRHPPLLIIAFVSGIAWSLIYSRCRNIHGIALSHSILGALAMFLGII